MSRPRTSGRTGLVAHAEDFFYETTPGGRTSSSSFVEGPIEWRVVATDTACNSNITQPDYVTAAVDLTCPTVCDYSVDKPTRLVVPNETMTFTVCLKDAVTDVRHVTLQAYDTLAQRPTSPPTSSCSRSWKARTSSTWTA
jgi:hypothetical protein